MNIYRRILIPLDGSKLAECVLPYVETLAQGCGTEEVILVSVTKYIVGTKHLTGYTQSIGSLPPYQTVTVVPVAKNKDRLKGILAG